MSITDERKARFPMDFYLQEQVHIALENTHESDYATRTKDIVGKNLEAFRIEFNAKYPSGNLGSTIQIKRNKAILFLDKKCSSNAFKNFITSTENNPNLLDKCLNLDHSTVVDFIVRDYENGKTYSKVSKTLDYFSVFVGFKGWEHAITCEFDLENNREIQKTQLVKRTNDYNTDITNLLKSIGLFSDQEIGQNTIEGFKEYDIRIGKNPEAKIKIAKGVKQLIDSSFDISTHPILLDTGSVTYYVSNELMKDGDGNIITNSIGIHLLSSKFKDYPVSTHQISGEFNPVVGAYVGSQSAREAIQQLTEGLGDLPKSKVAVLGLRAYNPKIGFAENTPSLSDFQAALFEYSEKLIVVAQGEKFLNKAFAPILESKKFNDLLEKKVKKKSIWFVYHDPNCKLTEGQKNAYQKNLKNFLKKLPEENVIDVTNKKLEKE